MLRASLLSGLFSIVILTVVPASAQTDQQIIKSDNPHIGKAQEKAVEIAKSFTPVEIENLSVIKDAFGIIRAVQVTNKNVGATVKKCGKENPELKTEMDAQYNDWKTGVTTVLGGKEKEMKAAIHDGRFSKPKDVMIFLDLLDKAAQYADDKMNKQIVSTPSACESLKESMDDTAEKLEVMLAELSFPIAVPREKEPSTSSQTGAHE